MQSATAIAGYGPFTGHVQNTGEREIHTGLKRPLLFLQRFSFIVQACRLEESQHLPRCCISPDGPNPPVAFGYP